MPNFSYLAADANGRDVKGTIEAETKNKAAEQIKKNGLVVISIAAESVLSKGISLSLFENKPKPRDMAVFCRQFVSIVEAGVAIVSALNMLAEQTQNKMLKNAITETRRAIESGESLANAMRPHSRIFSGIFITAVEAGEASGSLVISFTRMADQFEKEAHIKALVKKATIYPVIVAFVAVAVVIAMLTFIIPTFQDMFSQIGVELPVITQVVVSMSKFMQSYWLLVVATIAALVIFIKLFSKTESGKRIFGNLGLKLPLVGPLIVKTASSRMSRTLSTLLAAGIPLIKALEITADTMTNIYFREALLDAKDNVAMGTSLSEPLERSKLFPPLVYHMLKIGEDTGNIDIMLKRLADYYDDEVEIATQALMSAMEPMIIIVLAVVIGVIVLSVVLPMAKMYEGLDQL